MREKNFDIRYNTRYRNQNWIIQLFGNSLKCQDTSNISRAMSYSILSAYKDSDKLISFLERNLEFSKKKPLICCF